MFTLSPLTHSNAHPGCAARLCIWPGLPLSPSPIFISPLISSFVSISLSLISWKNNKKRERKTEAFIQQLGRHKGSEVPSIGVALTWLNSSSGESLVMSLIPKTSHAPFTASHTKLNAKSKTQTLGRKSVRKRLEQAFRSRAKGVRLLPRCPSVLPVGTPNFWRRKPRKKYKKNPRHLSPKACHCSAAFSAPISCLNSLKTTEKGRTTRSTVKTTSQQRKFKQYQKYQEMDTSPVWFSGELAIENSTRPTGGLKRGSPLLKPWSDHPLYHRCEPFNHSRKKWLLIFKWR